jgi:hypothetical protein
LDGLAQQVEALAADAGAKAGEMAQDQRLAVMQGQIDTLNQRVDTLSQ